MKKGDLRVAFFMPVKRAIQPNEAPRGSRACPRWRRIRRRIDYRDTAIAAMRRSDKPGPTVDLIGCQSTGHSRFSVSLTHNCAISIICTAARTYLTLIGHFRSRVMRYKLPLPI